MWYVMIRGLGNSQASYHLKLIPQRAKHAMHRVVFLGLKVVVQPKGTVAPANLKAEAAVKSGVIHHCILISAWLPIPGMRALL